MEFTGIYSALITPFAKSDSSSLDEIEFRRLLDRQVDGKVSGVVIGGSTGEGQALRNDELAKLLKIAVSDYSKKLRVIGACGSPSTWETIERFKEIAAESVQGILVSAPSYNRAPQRGLIAH